MRSRRFTFLLTKSEMCVKAPSSASLLTGFSRKAKAPMALPFLLVSVTEMTWTGMCRVRGLRFRRSRIAQPSTTGSWMSSVMAAGCSSLASARPVSPRTATTALKPFSRAMPTMMRANFTSSSMMRSTLSPSRRCSRSSSTGRVTASSAPGIISESRLAFGPTDSDGHTGGSVPCVFASATARARAFAPSSFSSSASGPA